MTQPSDDPAPHQDVSKRPTRSWLFTPATRPERFGKAKEAGVDVQIIDLEDSVAPAAKESARENAFNHLRDRDVNGPLIAVRINSVRTKWGVRDLDTLVYDEAQSDFVIIPKIESAAEITLVAALLEECGKSAAIVAMIESARAIARVEEIAESNNRLSHLLFGSADLAADLKAANTWEALYYARSRTVAAAALAGLPVIDAPTFNLSSNDQLEADLRGILTLGFAGKAAIHPKQVSEINRAFTPSLEEIKVAKQVLQENRKGVGIAGGHMVDEAVARHARRVLSVAQALGLNP
jgi:(S)-citramalyl-CoA lyase